MKVEVFDVVKLEDVTTAPVNQGHSGAEGGEEDEDHTLEEE